MARNTVTDNILVLNQGMNPLVNFNFLLRVELAFDLPCKSVKAFTREMEYEYIQEGGLNDYVHMRRKPISKPFTLEVERYAGVDYVDPLPLGAELLLPIFLFVSRYQNKFISVARTYVFTGCTVTKKVYGELLADRSGLLTDTITIAYREMICLDTPFTDVIAAPIVGTGKPTDKAWTAWKDDIDKKNREKMRQDIENLRLKELERAEINRKHMEEAAKNRKAKEDEIKALRDKLDALVKRNRQIADEIEGNRKETDKTLKELRAKELEVLAERARKMLQLFQERTALTRELSKLLADERNAAQDMDQAQREKLTNDRIAKEQELKALADRQAEETALSRQALEEIQNERKALEEQQLQLQNELLKNQEEQSALEVKIEDRVDELSAFNDAMKEQETSNKAKAKALEDERKALEADFEALYPEDGA